MKKYDLPDLLSVMDTLLGENGCPWDRVQTHETIKPELIEECYEAVDAIQNGDTAGLCEELGDLLLHVVFHSKIAEKNGEFTFTDIVHGITEKMIRRHSHVFGGKSAENPDESIDNWDKEKQKEKGYKSAADKLNAIPKAYPALLRAQKFIHIAKKAGLYENNPDTVEKFKRITENTDREPLTEAETGELLLFITELAEKNKVNAEIALTNAVDLCQNKAASDLCNED